MAKPKPKKYMTKQRRDRAASEAMTRLGRIGAEARWANTSPAERRAIGAKLSQAAAKARAAKKAAKGGKS